MFKVGDRIIPKSAEFLYVFSESYDMKKLRVVDVGMLVDWKGELNEVVSLKDKKGKIHQHWAANFRLDTGRRDYTVQEPKNKPGVFK